MRRRSFLSALFAVPVFGPALFRTAPASQAAAPRAVDANLGTVTAGILRSADGSLSIDLASGTFTIRDSKVRR
ncbi:hypothetical protein [Bradyrhizobium sp. C9]|uniref:hypothetical protein n=1 Tax=Bradyrhizobium sp. C9 TaxID=142585 RepID=UPI0011785F61|nr:hypothetical protein [Bradyrhizobium sp. C9]